MVKLFFFFSATVVGLKFFCFNAVEWDCGYVYNNCGGMVTAVLVLSRTSLTQVMMERGPDQTNAWHCLVSLPHHSCRQEELDV